MDSLILIDHLSAAEEELHRAVDFLAGTAQQKCVCDEVAHLHDRLIILLEDLFDREQLSLQTARHRFNFRRIHRNLNDKHV